MGRRRNSANGWGCLLVIGGIFLFFTLASRATVALVAAGVTALIVAGLFVFIGQVRDEERRRKEAEEQRQKRRKEDEERARALKVEDVDNMSGIEFERYVGRLLTHQGFQVEMTPGSGDLGVDIIAQKDGTKYSIQVKRQNDDVPRNAISDAVAGIEL